MTVAFVEPGRDSRHCGSPKRQGPGTCTRPAGWGTSHVGVGRCKLHGGSTPTHEKHAEKVQAEAAVVKYGLPRTVDPATALLEEIHRTAGAVAWLDQQVTAMTTVDPGDPLVELYARERKHLAAISRDAIALKIAEREVLVAQAYGEQMVTLMRLFFTALAVEGLALEDPRVSAAMRTALTELVPRRVNA